MLLIGSYSCLLLKTCRAYVELDRSVLYTLCVLGTFILEYDLFVQRRKFTSSTRELANPTVHIFVYIIVYFWFCKIVYSVGTPEGNPYIGPFKEIGNLAQQWTVVYKCRPSF
jgi:hypothetical protein